ncbi:QacE family quaternary ammonium compound efflux SMR transporter [Klebsiella pneumoniae]|uniref:QacE family quaternary ammonium compound efflux SMR transporter n=1 Tax=Klebsiella pneumoniae TaxID=573 RepID=A0A939STW2_KLEPN|nr:QacE family quaternary ammonium compound efflux SMR transporter [Klebsiella pneumoniae]
MFNLGFLWLALSIGSEITGTSMIKTNGFNWRLRRWWSAPTACATSPSPAMSTIPVGVAYSLWCGFGIVGVTICSMILYKQKPDWRPLSPWR